MELDYEKFDLLDKNLIYEYIIYLSGISKRIENLNRDDEETVLLKRLRALKIIWFVFRYVFGCKTYEQAEKVISKKTIETFKLGTFFNQGYIFIGSNIIVRDVEDIDVILRILYERLNYVEGLRLFEIKQRGKNRTTTANKCTKEIAFFRRTVDYWRENEKNEKKDDDK